MAGDWIKMRTHLGSERATMTICELTGLDPFAVVGRLHAVWCWAGEHTSNGDVRGVTLKTIDRIAAHEGFASAMSAAGWLEEVQNSGVRFPRWNKHNSKSARARALAAERQAKRRAKKSRTKRDTERDAKVTSHAPRREETRGDERREDQSSKSDRKTIGSSALNSRSSRSPQSPKRISVGSEEQPEPLDLSAVDWQHAVAMVESAAKRVPPLTVDDRRSWLKFGVLADRCFSESWLIDAAEAVVRAAETRRTPQAHFVAVLKRKAAEQHGIDEPNFTAMVRRIEIPNDVWHSPVLEVRQ